MPTPYGKPAKGYPTPAYALHLLHMSVPMLQDVHNTPGVAPAGCSLCLRSTVMGPMLGFFLEHTVKLSHHIQAPPNHRPALLQLVQ